MTNCRNLTLHYCERSGQKSLFSRGRWGNWNTDKFYLPLIIHRAQCSSPLVSRLLDLNFISMSPQLYPPLTNCQIKTPLRKKGGKVSQNVFLKMDQGYNPSTTSLVAILSDSIPLVSPLTIHSGYLQERRIWGCFWMSKLYSSREPMTALGKPCLILSICHFLSWPLLPSSRRIWHGGKWPASLAAHPVFRKWTLCVRFRPNAGKEPQALPQLETSAVIVPGAYSAFPFLKIANDVIWEDIKRTPGWPIIVFLGRPPVHNHFLKRKREETLSDGATHSPLLYFFKASWIWAFETRDSVGPLPSECRATPTGSAACSFEHLQLRRSS